MELRQLVYFEAVVRHGGFSRAGEQLRVAQPAVSAQIRRLEAELGTPLLRRTTRQVALTEAGELFLVRVRAVLDQLDLARAELSELTAVLRGRVRIGATPVLSTLDLPAALARFHRRHPSVTLTLRTGLIADLRDALDSGELDLVVGPLHPGLAESHLAHPLAEESVVLATAPGHRTAGRTAGGRRAIALADLRDEPFVCLPRGTGLRAILTAAAARAGFEPRIEFEADTPANVRELVAVGLGVALLAESVALAAGPAIDILRLDDAPEHPPIGCILPRRRAANPATRAFVQQLADSAAGAGRG
ncbi:MAG TPA: LysR family transcriptional regulator [Actinocrinis sp.]|jgi:DNA-binding transcriptional LysR family regulator|uniref:LysR family transcriptional regulator n=1 Tax=Actinocrinis sp. TaxID=1920516 RepID=UPI002DDD017F|nr:LysR family transcriptional regulator [Actinocrinis sp.]HEV3173464.1 LysR family transcriptional regulator [Actinocrinis sp.]